VYFDSEFPVQNESYIAQEKHVGPLFKILFTSQLLVPRAKKEEARIKEFVFLSPFVFFWL